MPTNKFSVVELPTIHSKDIPAQLRALADEIESGDLGTIAQLAYVMDGGQHNIQVGLMGQSDSAGAETYLLFGVGQKIMLSNIG